MRLEGHISSESAVFVMNFFSVVFQPPNCTLGVSVFSVSGWGFSAVARKAYQELCTDCVMLQRAPEPPLNSTRNPSADWTETLGGFILTLLDKHRKSYVNCISHFTICLKYCRMRAVCLPTRLKLQLQHLTCETMFCSWEF